MSVPYNITLLTMFPSRPYLKSSIPMSGKTTKSCFRENMWKWKMRCHKTSRISSCRPFCQYKIGSKQLQVHREGPKMRRMKRGPIRPSSVEKHISQLGMWGTADLSQFLGCGSHWSNCLPLRTPGWWLMHVWAPSVKPAPLFAAQCHPGPQRSCSGNPAYATRDVAWIQVKSPDAFMDVSNQSCHWYYTHY